MTNLQAQSNLHPDANITTTTLPWPPAHISIDKVIASFIAQQQCLWLSSCYPHFKQFQQTRDSIAGGFSAWLTAQNNKHQLFINDKPQQDHKKPVTPVRTWNELPQDWMAQQLASASDNTSRALQPGWYGGFAYHYNSGSLGITKPLQQEADWPAAVFGFATWVITLDFIQQQVCLKILDPNTLTSSDFIAQRWQQALCQQLELPLLQVQPWQARTSKPEYLKALTQVQDYIDAGDCYQVNYTQCFTSHYQGEPLAGFLSLKSRSPSPYAAYWSCPWGVVASHSPELFLAFTAAPFQVITKPIKGTAPRHADQVEDQQHASELMQCEKNRAENIMIVDLLRNDLSKTAKAGGLQVTKLCALESFTQIHHLVSEIRADIAPGFGVMDCLLGCFPGGSITGAPKRRAMEIIDELEYAARDIYCGSIGAWDQPQHAIFNIAIRTLLFNLTNKSVKIWAGGGITQDSDPAAEYAECFHKVKKLMDILEE